MNKKLENINQDNWRVNEGGVTEVYLNEKQLAKRLGISIRTLQAWRQSGAQDLSYCKFGSRVAYAMSEILEYEHARLRKHTSE